MDIERCCFAKFFLFWYFYLPVNFIEFCCLILLINFFDNLITHTKSMLCVNLLSISELHVRRYD